VAAVRGVKQFLTFAGGTPLQHAAAVALEQASEEPRALAASLAEKRDLLSTGLSAAGFDVFPSAGTYFLTADARPLGFDDAVTLCERLPLEAGVVAIPTSAFTADPVDRTRSLVRFAFCKRRGVLEDAVARIESWAKP
jgi:N-succinyldiaminopimelate aminotransferase